MRIDVDMAGRGVPGRVDKERGWVAGDGNGLLGFHSTPAPTDQLRGYCLKRGLINSLWTVTR